MENEATVRSLLVGKAGSRDLMPRPRETLPTPAQRKQLLADGYQVVVEGKESKGGKQ